MQFVFGLGNPGTKYLNTRHNVGFKVVEELGQRLNFDNFVVKDKFQADVSKKGELLLAKPRTFMNQSGQAVRAMLDFYQIDTTQDLTNVWVIHDDLDIELGKYKLQFGVGPKVHHGLQSIYQNLKTDQFWHVRVGIDGRAGNRSILGETYVLQNFSPLETEQLVQTINHLSTELMNKIALY